MQQQSRRCTGNKQRSRQTRQHSMLMHELYTLWQPGIHTMILGHSTLQWHLFLHEVAPGCGVQLRRTVGWDSDSCRHGIVQLEAAASRHTVPSSPARTHTGRHICSLQTTAGSSHQAKPGQGQYHLHGFLLFLQQGFCKRRQRHAKLLAMLSAAALAASLHRECCVHTSLGRACGINADKSMLALPTSCPLELAGNYVFFGAAVASQHAGETKLCV